MQQTFGYGYTIWYLSIPAPNLGKTLCGIGFICLNVEKICMSQKGNYTIMLKKDGKFYSGYCLEIPQAKGQGNTRDEAIKDTKKAIILCKSYLEDKKNDPEMDLITVSI